MEKLKTTIDVELSGVRVSPRLRASLLRAAEKETRRQRHRQRIRLFGGMAGLAAALLVAVGLAMVTRGFRLLPGGDGSGATTPVSLSQPDETAPALKDFDPAPGSPAVTSEPTPPPTESHSENASIDADVDPLPAVQDVEYLGENVQMLSCSYNGRVLVARFYAAMQQIESVGVQLEALNPADGTDSAPTPEYTSYRAAERLDGRLDLTVIALLDEAYMPENVLASLYLNDEMLALVATGPTRDIQSANMALTGKARLWESDALGEASWQSTEGVTAELALRGGTFWLTPPVVIADIALESVRYDVGGTYYHVSAACAAKAAGIDDIAGLAGAQRPLEQLQDAGQLPCPACMPEGDDAYDLYSCAVENWSGALSEDPLQDLALTIPSGGFRAHIAGWRELDSQADPDGLSASVVLYGNLGSGEYRTSTTRLDVGVLPDSACEAGSASEAGSGVENVVAAP